MVDLLRLAGYVVFVIYALSSFWLVLNGLMQLHLLWHYKRRPRAVVPPNTLSDFPFVSIQVPVYNEKYVIERLLGALSRLDYPRDKFEIQVLDDSTDETRFIIDRFAETLSKNGVAVSVVRRAVRTGYKAGALQFGLPQCKGDLIAIFDADFIPDAPFLKKMLPHFAEAQTGLVQARWSHLNREQNHLTRIQTFLLDTHFSVEQGGRAGAGYFINFCGTAGIWRRRCIEEAGGWDGSVLSEDLDLSYRAQLKGWKLVYAQNIKVPAELPSAMEAFKIQQFRWTKGMAQISKKTLTQIFKTPLPAGKKIHAAFHLLSSLVFLCLFLNILLTIPLLAFRNLYPEFITLTRYTAVSSLNLLALTLFYYNGTRTGDVPGGVKFFTHYPLFLVVYMGLSVQNSVAVLQGLFGRKSEFVRTPKSAVTSEQNNTYLAKDFTWINGLEVAILGYIVFGVWLSIYLNDYFMLLFFAMIGYGLAFIIYHSLRVAYPKRGFKWA